MLITIITLALAAAGFVWGRIRADIVALIALLVLTLSGILSPQEALSGFSNPIVVMMVGLFIVGGAIFNTGLAKMIGAKLSHLGNGSPTRLFLVVVLATGLIGGFVSNTGTVALMLPIVVSMAAASGASVSRFLMPLAFASSIGGMLTLIGTPPNLVIAETWEEHSGQPLTMFSFLPTGLICLVAGTVLLIPLSRLLSAKKQNSGSSQDRRSLADIVEEYNLNHDLWRVDVPASSPISGLSLGALSLRANYGVDVLELRVKRRGLLKNVTQEAPSASSVIEEGDILFIRGPRQNVERFVTDYGLRIADDNDESRRHLDFYDIGLAEIVVLPNSGVLKETIAGLDFRKTYNVNILGVRRGGEYITDNLGDRKVAKGDVLLVQGTWKAIEKISRNTQNWVVLGEPESQASKVTIDYKAPMAAVIMLAMISGLVFSSVHSAQRHRTHDADRMLPHDCRRLRNHQLGEHRAYSGHDADEFRAGENRRQRDSERSACGCTRRDWSPLADGRHLLHHIFAHPLHFQYGHCRADGADCSAECRGLWRKSAANAVCRHLRRLALLHVALLHAA